jgi:hypothetical protein
MLSDKFILASFRTYPGPRGVRASLVPRAGDSDGLKRDKMHVLKLDNDEWEWVDMFLGLLTVHLSCISMSFKQLTQLT